MKNITGEHGYLKCRACGHEAQEISKETCEEYRFHVKCNPTLFGYVDQRERFKEFLERKVGR